MKAKKSLQKLTESEVKINNLLSLDTITVEDTKILTQEEKDLFYRILDERIKTLQGLELNLFCEKVVALFNQETKNQLWENNHNSITACISNLMQEYGRMPSKSEIAAKTELSRQTVHKHLKEYSTHPQYLEQIEQFRFLTSKVLTKVFQYAVNGDIKAAKLYLEIMGGNLGHGVNNTLIKTQNNYIQINGTILSQEEIKKLNPEQLNSIEQILKTVLPEVSEKPK